MMAASRSDSENRVCFDRDQKFQHQRFFKQVHGLEDDLPLLGQLANAVLVAAQGQALVQAALKLVTQLSQSQVLLGRLDFIKALFLRSTTVPRTSSLLLARTINLSKEPLHAPSLFPPHCLVPAADPAGLGTARQRSG